MFKISFLMLSQTEENYLKAIYKNAGAEQSVSTNAISKTLKTSAASVTDMLKKLADKDLLHYEKYKGVRLTDSGRSVSTHLIRKHRLWEVFLYKKLNFKWGEVHDIAEQLEHIQSPELVERLDAFLGFPKVDPHGDPIPDAEGNYEVEEKVLLSELPEGARGKIIGLAEHSKNFLAHLDAMDIKLGLNIKIIEKFSFDNSIKIKIKPDKVLVLSAKVAQSLFINK